MHTPSPVGAALAKLRAAAALSLRDLAERSGVPHSTIHSLEMGYQQDTSTEHLRKLAAALDVEVSKLLDTEGPDAPGVKRIQRTSTRKRRAS